MVALYFSHLSLVGGSTIGMGIKKSTDPVPYSPTGLRQPQMYYG